MAEKSGKYVVCHDSLYLSGAGGKLEQQKRGTELTLSADQAKKLMARGFIVPVKSSSK